MYLSREGLCDFWHIKHGVKHDLHRNGIFFYWIHCEGVTISFGLLIEIEYSLQSKVTQWWCILYSYLHRLHFLRWWFLLSRLFVLSNLSTTGPPHFLQTSSAAIVIGYTLGFTGNTRWYQLGKLLIVTFCEKASLTADLLHAMNASSELQWTTKNLLVTSRCGMSEWQATTHA